MGKENWKAKDDSFAELFREARIEKEVPLRHISMLVGLSIGYLSDIEHKRRNPPNREVVKKIEEFLNIQDGRLSKAATEEFSKTPRGKLECENASLSARIAELEAALKSLEDEAFRVVDSEPGYPHLRRAVVRAQEVLEAAEIVRGGK